MTTKMIHWPLLSAEGELYIRSEWRADECLRFHSDGTISSNGGQVDHDDITEEQIELLPEADQQFVRSFLSGNYAIAETN